MGMELAPEIRRKMAEFSTIILRANRRLNLTRLVKPREMAVKHFLDSLSILLLDLPKKAACLDLGTGAGFPGLPLALVKDEWPGIWWIHCASGSFFSKGRWTTWALLTFNAVMPGRKRWAAKAASGKNMIWWSVGRWHLYRSFWSLAALLLLWAVNLLPIKGRKAARN